MNTTHALSPSGRVVRRVSRLPSSSLRLSSSSPALEPASLSLSSLRPDPDRRSSVRLLRWCRLDELLLSFSFSFSRSRSLSRSRSRCRSDRSLSRVGDRDRLELDDLVLSSLDLSSRPLRWRSLSRRSLSLSLSLSLSVRDDRDVRGSSRSLSVLDVLERAPRPTEPS